MALLIEFEVFERNAVKGEWKDRRSGWINSDSIPMSIPTPSHYVEARCDSHLRAPPFGYVEHQKYRFKLFSGDRKIQRGVRLKALASSSCERRRA
jgi:hypothetical protein